MAARKDELIVERTENGEEDVKKNYDFSVKKFFSDL